MSVRHTFMVVDLFQILPLVIWFRLRRCENLFIIITVRIVFWVFETCACETCVDTKHMLSWWILGVNVYINMKYVNSC